MDIDTKVKAAQGLLNEAHQPRRRARPGDLVMYHTYKTPDEVTQGGDYRLSGLDIVKEIRTTEPRIFLRRLARWLFTGEVLLLPKDALYESRMRRYLEGGKKED